MIVPAGGQSECSRRFGQIRRRKRVVGLPRGPGQARNLANLDLMFHKILIGNDLWPR
jgi:hypothetical protein